MLLLAGILVLLCSAPIIDIADSVQFPVVPTSEISNDDKNSEHKRETTFKIDIDNNDPLLDGHEFNEKNKEQMYLEEALKTILDPSTAILTKDDTLKQFKTRLAEVEQENNNTLENFMNTMDALSLDVCVESQKALWFYDIRTWNDGSNQYMVNIQNIEQDVKNKYWEIIKMKYLDGIKIDQIDSSLNRKISRIRKRNLQMPKIEDRAEINDMKTIWNAATVCPYNISTCTADNSILYQKDIAPILTSSNDTDELVYYWKSWRDATGKKIRPIFKKYIIRMNNASEANGFDDMNEMWHNVYEDRNFPKTVRELWDNVKPLYDALHDYVRLKLKIYYKDKLNIDKKNIPAHLLGNLWAHEWREIYSKVAPYPDHHLSRLVSNSTVKPKYLFDIVDQFHQSLGFESAKDAYESIEENMSTDNCKPSSYDFCNGINYSIKWCSEEITDINAELCNVAKLLGRVQYFKHYSNLSVIFRDGPTPAFVEGLSDVYGLLVTNPVYMKNFDVAEVDESPEAELNYLLWVALEKIPMMAYALVLDKWRFDIFKVNSSLAENEKWNQHWWKLREQETDISPPVSRNESDLDPASTQHVEWHEQYSKYLISTVLEFQVLLSLCKSANHTGPLHQCSLYGNKEAGARLSKAMSLGSTQHWRDVLETITNKTSLSAEGIIDYFSPLELYLKNESIIMRQKLQMDQSAPIVVGVLIFLLTLMIIVLYCAKKHNLRNRMFSACGLGRNDSHNVETDIQMQGPTHEIEVASEEKVGKI